MFSALIVFVIVAALIGLLITYVPMPEPIRTVIVVVAAIFILLYALRAFGLAGL